MSNCCCKIKDEKEIKMQKIIDRHKGKKGALIPVLHEVQEIYGYLPLHVQKKVSEELDIPLAEIYGVVSFYTQFTIFPKGKYKIQVCLGTACYVKGAGDILDKIKKELDINVGECTKDGKFSLEAARCIGACGLAPVMMINDKVYGRLVPDDIPGIIKEYKDKDE